MSKLEALVDAFAAAVPFSIVGAAFGDVIRKEPLTKPQRAVVGMFSFVMGPICGGAAYRDFGLGEITSYAIAAVVPTITFDVVGLVVAVIRSARNDSDHVLSKLWELVPWGRKQ